MKQTYLEGVQDQIRMLYGERDHLIAQGKDFAYDALGADVIQAADAKKLAFTCRDKVEGIDIAVRFLCRFADAIEGGNFCETLEPETEVNENPSPTPIMPQRSFPIPESYRMLMPEDEKRKFDLTWDDNVDGGWRDLKENEYTIFLPRLVTASDPYPTIRFSIKL